MTSYSLDESRTATNYTDGSAAGRDIPTEIVIHHWGVDGQTHDGVVNWFCTPGNGCGTSAHFVASAGRVHCIVSTTDVAWHAGDWAVNLRSIGIECRPEATDADYTTIAELIRDMRDLYGNLPLRPHKAYAQTDCPGRYDLARLDRLARATTVKPQGNKPAPIPQKDWFDMATKEDLRSVIGEFLSPIQTSAGPVSVKQFIADGTRAAQKAAEQTGAILRGGKQVSLKQEVADIKTKVLGLEPVIADIAAQTDPAQIAALIPAEIAGQVIEALSAKLGGK